MDLWTAFSRARRGFRDDMQLHVVAIASLVVAFLCLGSALLGMENLARLAERWTQTQHLTLYLVDGVGEDDVAQLRLVLESLQEVEKVSFVSAQDARKAFAEQTDFATDIGALPTEAFPASLELDIAEGVADGRITKIAERIKGFAAVEEVETYRDWFGQLGSLVTASKTAAGVFALLVAICVLAVISNSIRLAVANRREEIAVLKLCGATDSFVRAPLVLEGVIHGTVAAGVAMILLVLGYLLLRVPLEGTITALTGMRTVFLAPLSVLGIVVGGALCGALGSLASIRRHLTV